VAVPAAWQRGARSAEPVTLGLLVARRDQPICRAPVDVLLARVVGLWTLVRSSGDADGRWWAGAMLIVTGLFAAPKVYGLLRGVPRSVLPLGSASGRARGSGIGNLRVSRAVQQAKSPGSRRHDVNQKGQSEARGESTRSDHVGQPPMQRRRGADAVGRGADGGRGRLVKSN
jgi:hypothetical protein